MNADGTQMTFNEWVSSQPDYSSITECLMKRNKKYLVEQVMKERHTYFYTLSRNIELEEKVSEAEAMYKLKEENEKLKELLKEAEPYLSAAKGQSSLSCDYKDEEKLEDLLIEIENI